MMMKMVQWMMKKMRMMDTETTIKFAGNTIPSILDEDDDFDDDFDGDIKWTMMTIKFARNAYTVSCIFIAILCMIQYLKT